MIKKILIAFFALASFNTQAAVGPFGVLTPDELKVERPLFDLYYTQLQEQTLNGEVKAYLEGGLRYYYGYSRRLDMATPKDYTAAAKWFYEAAMKNDEIAAYFLGVMYLRGQGVKAEYKAAIFWLSKASKAGLKDATYMLGNVFYQMSQDPRFPESYKEFYFNQAKLKYLELETNSDPKSLFNLGYMEIKHNEKTRFTDAKANEYLLRAMPGFIAAGDRVNAYEVLKIMRFNKLAGYNQAENLFNTNFKANNANGFDKPILENKKANSPYHQMPNLADPQVFQSL